MLLKFKTLGFFFAVLDHAMFNKGETMIETKPVQTEGPVTPRCLATLPINIEEILKAFETQR